MRNVDLRLYVHNNPNNRENNREGGPNGAGPSGVRTTGPRPIRTRSETRANENRKRPVANGTRAKTKNRLERRKKK